MGTYASGKFDGELTAAEEIVDSVDDLTQHVEELTDTLYKIGAGLGVFAPGDGVFQALDPPVLQSIARSLSDVAAAIRETAVHHD